MTTAAAITLAVVVVLFGPVAFVLYRTNQRIAQHTDRAAHRAPDAHRTWNRHPGITPSTTHRRGQRARDYNPALLDAPDADDTPTGQE